jgi:hypothetical protein
LERHLSVVRRKTGRILIAGVAGQRNRCKESFSWGLGAMLFIPEDPDSSQDQEAHAKRNAFPSAAEKRGLHCLAWQLGRYA